MLLQKDVSNSGFIMMFILCGCIGFILIEAYLPGFRYGKSLLLSAFMNEFKLTNNGSTAIDGSSIYYLDSNERQVRSWLNSSLMAEELESKGYMKQIEQAIATTRQQGNATYAKLCTTYMMQSRFVTDKSTFSKADDINHMMQMAKDSVPIMCRLLTANLANILDSLEMVQYFSVIMLNGIKKYVDNTDFNVISQTRSLIEERSNIFMTSAVEANLNISTDYWARLQNCKSDILYTPSNCIKGTDFAVFDKSVMKSVYGVDYSTLESYFAQRKDEFSIIASTSVTPKVNDTNVILAMKHFMHRSNVVVAFEPSVSRMKRILRGMGLSKLHAKQRCTEVFFFTSTCTRKNLVSVIPPCYSDTRDSGNDMSKIQCTLASIYILGNMTSWVSGTVFEKLGRELNDNPKITAQVFHWSFYDENRIPMITT